MLDPSVGFNGESWIIARALRFARELLSVRAVLSYADPIARVDTQGALRKPAHWGTIYQASNALFAGRAEPRTLLVAPSGAVISQRSLTKIRKQERGHLYAERQLLVEGADPRRFGEDPSAWLERASAHFRRIRHPGNLAYLFGLDGSARSALQQRHGARPYLKKTALDSAPMAV